MADPFTLTALSIGSSIAGSGLGALSSMGTANAKASAYNYQAGIAEQNAKIAKQNMDYSLGAGELQAQQYGMKERYQLGETRAAQGASNINLNTGTSTDVVAGERAIGDLDLAQIRANAARRAYGYYVEGQQDTAQAGAYRAAASDTKSAGTLAALGSLISGVGSVSSKWLQAGTVGISPGGYYG